MKEVVPGVMVELRKAFRPPEHPYAESLRQSFFDMGNYARTVGLSAVNFATHPIRSIKQALIIY